jgi:hypothetical protein|tara:strand:+ start:1768 stop:1974 length:207 start_codon:yes stop_codon:yes gene_type:complete
MAKKRKNLLKKDPVTPPNMSYEEKVELKTTGKIKKKEVVKKEELSSDSHVQYVKPRVKTSINDRMRNN